MKFDLIEKADLSLQEFAEIVGISRVSLGKLINNGNAARIARALDMLDALVSNGKLPRGYGREDKEKRNALVQKLKERLDKVVP